MNTTQLALRAKMSTSHPMAQKFLVDWIEGNAPFHAYSDKVRLDAITEICKINGVSITQVGTTAWDTVAKSLATSMDDTRDPLSDWLVLHAKMLSPQDAALVQQGKVDKAASYAVDSWTSTPAIAIMGSHIEEIAAGTYPDDFVMDFSEVG
ncbi:hypothetical protein EEDFHM_04073 [Methylorubrum populi]